MASTRDTVSWVTVVLISLIVAAATSAVFITPILSHKRLVFDRERWENIESTVSLDRMGLSVCRSELSYRLDEPVTTLVAGSPRLSIDTMPSFENGSRILLIGTEVHLVLLYTPLSGVPPPPPKRSPTRNSSSPESEVFPSFKAQVFQAPLSPGTALELSQLFSSHISSSGIARRSGLDGVTFVFRAGGHCAETWSPRPETGAGRLARIGDLLSRHARLSTQADLEGSERKIARLMRSFQGKRVAAE